LQEDAMPIYEYACAQCGHQFELMQRIGEAAPERCEKCGAPQVERQVSQTSFMLKGTGWYATDYAGRKAHGAEAAPPCASGGCATGACPVKTA
jgi:putative FmdB family regulatory protein